MIFESKKELRKEFENAEKRALIHYQERVKLERKLKHISFIIDEADRTSEFYIETLTKIKRVLANGLENNN